MHLANESTDISCEKHICICVRFFDDTTDQIGSCFLGLIPVMDATGESLFNAISTLAGDFGMVLSDCIGFPSASNMIGEHNSIHCNSKVCFNLQMMRMNLQEMFCFQSCPKLESW